MAALTLDESLDALHGGGGWWWGTRDVVEAVGPDAATYLQGQLSQDVDALAVGASAPSLLLHPDGKTVALLRITRLAHDRFLLDTDAGAGDAVLARLRRFLLRVKVELSAWDGPTRALAVRGADDAVLAEVRASIEGAPGAVAVPAIARDGFDVDVLVPAGAELAAPAGLPEVDPAAGEVLRIEQGVPVSGVELTERTIPGEAGAWVIDVAVSFTKGCYTGQELVARIDSRGNNVPHHLRGVVLDHPVPVGTELVVDGKVVGALTSVAARPGGDAVALAFVGRAVDPPSDATLADGTAARILELPLPPTP